MIMQRAGRGSPNGYPYTVFHQTAGLAPWGVAVLVACFAVLEIAALALAQIALENGVSHVSRQMRTGQVRAGTLEPDTLRGLLCARVAVLVECSERLVLDIQRFRAFSGDVPPRPGDGMARAPAASSGSGLIDLRPVFEPGAPGDLVIVRVSYQWPLTTPLIGRLFADGGGHIIEAAYAFHNTPGGRTLPNG